MALRWQLSKRLEKGRFLCPSASEGKVALTPAPLAMRLDGIDWRAVSHVVAIGSRLMANADLALAEGRIGRHLRS